jgi:DNA-binding NarL/FixJ family response regulator
MADDEAQRRAVAAGGHPQLAQACTGGTTQSRRAGSSASPAGRTVRVVVADRNWVFRHGLRSVLENARPVRVVAEATSSPETLAVVRHLRPDALLLTVTRGAGDQLDTLPIIARLTRVVAFAGTADCRLITSALAAGVTAFLVHGEYSTGDLYRAVLDSRASRPHLSPSAAVWAHTSFGRLSEPQQAVGMQPGSQLSQREREIMDHIARGMSNGEIACLLHLREKTVKNHVNRIFAKLCVSSRAQAIVLWLSERQDPAGRGPGTGGPGPGAAATALTVCGACGRAA